MNLFETGTTGSPGEATAGMGYGGRDVGQKGVTMGYLYRPKLKSGASGRVIWC
jgi:hypothetical protein